MKFTKKVGVIVAGTALLGTSMAALPINSTNYVKAAEERIQTREAAVVGSYKISGLKQFNKEYKVGDTVTLTKPTFEKIGEGDLGGTVETVLISPSNNNIELTVDQTEVKLDERGTYLLYYVLKNGDNELAKSETVEINVVGSNYEFEFPANQYFDYKETDDSEVERFYTFIPNETAPKSNFKFTLPMPNVLLAKTGEQQTGASVSVKVAKSNGDVIMSYAGGTSSITVPDEAYKPLIKEREVTAYDKDGKALADKVKAITIEAKAEDVGDVYKITYSYDDGDSSSKIESVYDVKISSTESFKPDDNTVRELTATFEGTGASTSAVIGKKVTMPTPKVTNKIDSNEQIVFRTKMEVCFVDKSGVEWSLDETPVQNKRTDISANFSFIPNQNGLYRVYYKAFDAYGNETRENCYIIKNVTDSEAPVVKFVENYDVDGDGKLVTKPEDVKDGAYLLPTVVSASSETINNYGGTVDATSGAVTGGESKTFAGKIYVPAVYGTDNVTTFDKLTLTRTIRIKNGYFANGNKTLNVEDEWKRQNPGKTYEGKNKGVYINLEKKGDYTVEFSANDGNRTSISSYDVTIKEGNIDSELPTINDLKVGYTYQQNSEIKFAVPTATDDIDTRLKVEVGYVFATETEFNNKFTSGEMDYNADFKTKFEALKTPSHSSIDARVDSSDDLDNYYIKTATEEKTLYIVTIVMDYANRNKTEGQKVRVLVTKVNPAKIEDGNAVKFKNTLDGTEPETGSKNGYFKAGKFENVYQGFEVKLPSVNFVDVEDSRFNVSVYVSYVDGGKLTGRTYTGATIVSVPEGADFTPEGEYKICRMVYGGSFIPSKAGTYVVTYTAKDAGGHIETVSFPMTAIQTEKPSIIPQGYNETMELGDTQTFYQAVIMNNGERVNNPEDVELEMVNYGADREEGVNLTNEGFDPVNKTFTPTMPGEYHFRFKYSVKPLNALEGEEPLVGVSDIIKIKVQDTTKPEITLNKNAVGAVKFVGEGQTTYYKNLTPKTEGSTTEYEDIEIPNFTASDKFYGSQNITYSFSVKKDGTSIRTEGEAGRGANLRFTPGKSENESNINANGTYTITYTAEDINGNTTTQTYNLAVGDIEAPKITFKGSDAIKKQNQPSGEIKLSKKGTYQLVINASKDYILATDDNKFASANANDDGTFKEVSVTLMGPDGTVKGDYNNGVYTYNLTTAGKYTLTYRVTDEAGNPTSVPYTFTLVKNDSKVKTSTIVWSVILSVLALIGLGVAIYFLLRDKNNKKGKKQKKEINKEEQDDDKIVV